MSVIRFSAILAVVAAAVGLLVAGAISGSLLVVYLAIGVAALALAMLIAGVVIWREEIFGEPAAVEQAARAAEPAEAADSAKEPVAARQPELTASPAARGPLTVAESAPSPAP